MMAHILLLAAGLAILIAGAEVLVRGGSSLARHLGLTPLVVGLTVVAFGTSAPEMVVSIGGSLRGYDDIAIGNVVGSNIFNMGFILGLCAVVSPIVIRLGVIKQDAPAVLAASLLAVWLITRDSISRAFGLLLLVLLVLYTAWNVWQARKQASIETDSEFAEGIPETTRSMVMDVVLILIGLGLLIAGSKLLLSASLVIARQLGVGEEVIALTIMAAGTSMPELATSFVAALRKQSDIAMGNILGSNIFNILGILGLAAVVKPLQPLHIQTLDLWVMVLFVIVSLPMFWTGRRLQRWEGGLLLAGYIAYVYIRWPHA